MSKKQHIHNVTKIGITYENKKPTKIFHGDDQTDVEIKDFLNLH